MANPYDVAQSGAVTYSSMAADELWRHAEVCHVLNLMRPYFESIIS
jgi:hypothetical protein